MNESKALPSMFSRSGAKRGVVPPNLAELESFNLLGVFPYEKELCVTEVKLKSTAIFVNSNPSFDNYFTEMRRRNILKGYTTTQTGFTTFKGNKSNDGISSTPDQRRKSHTASSLTRNSQKHNAEFEMETTPEVRQMDKNPVSRDGHAAVVLFNSLFIFGGDRHRMSFNDLNILPLTPHL